MIARLVRPVGPMGPRLALLSGLLAAGCIPIDVGPLPLPDARPPVGCETAADCDAEGVAEGACLDGRCVIERCAEGRADADGDPDNGCERACPGVAEPDRCDGVDSDCDGRLDEDGDDTAEACGACDARCAGPSASYTCVEGACAIAACDPGRYPVDGDPASGCPCDRDALTVDRIPLAPPVAPVAPRLAFPGDGSPGAVVWTAVAGGVHRLWRWPLTPDGYPQGPPAEITPLAGPRDVEHAWFTGAGELVVIVSGPGDEIDPELVAYVDGARRPLGDGCDRDRCRVVSAPPAGPALVRLIANGARARVIGPDDGTLVEWVPAAEEPAPALISAACIDPSHCVVLLRRAGEIESVGIADAALEAFEEVTVARVGERIWFAGRVADQIVIAAVDRAGEVSEGIALPAGWGDLGLLALAGGGALLVGDDDGAPSVWRLDPDHQPIGEARALAGGFLPAGVADGSIVFDHSPRAATVERLLWNGLPRSTPDPDASPAALPGYVVYRGDPGLFVAPLDAEPTEPRLALVRLDRPPTAPAAARLDGIPTLVEAGPDGLIVIEIGEAISRRVLPLDRAGAPLVPSPDLSLTPDGWLALAGALTDGQGVIGAGPLDGDAVALHPTGGRPERAPRLIGTRDGARWLATRAEPGAGFETLLRPIAPDGTPGPARALARRLARDAAVAGDGQYIYLAWLDRRSDRCDGGATDARVMVLDSAGHTLSDASIPLDEACPRALDATAAVGGGAHVVITTDDMLMRVTIDRRGAPVDEPARLEARPGVPALGGPSTVVWTTADAIEQVDFDCREAAR